MIKYKPYPEPEVKKSEVESEPYKPPIEVLGMQGFEWLAIFLGLVVLLPILALLFLAISPIGGGVLLFIIILVGIFGNG